MGHWGLRSCGIGQFFMRYFRNFNLELRYCGILQTCGMRFLSVLVYDSRYKNLSFAFFRISLAVLGRFGSKLKQPNFVKHFFIYNLTVLTTSLKSCQGFYGTTGLFLPHFSHSRQQFRQLCKLSMKLRYFPNCFADCDICRFFCGNAVFSTPQCPPPYIYCIIP